MKWEIPTSKCDAGSDSFIFPNSHLSPVILETSIPSADRLSLPDQPLPSTSLALPRLSSAGGGPGLQQETEERRGGLQVKYKTETEPENKSSKLLVG